MSEILFSPTHVCKCTCMCIRPIGVCLLIHTTCAHRNNNTHVDLDERNRGLSLWGRERMSLEAGGRSSILGLTLHWVSQESFHPLLTDRNRYVVARKKVQLSQKCKSHTLTHTHAKVSIKAKGFVDMSYWGGANAYLWTTKMVVMRMKMTARYYRRWQSARSWYDLT